MKIQIESTEYETIWSRSIREELLATLKLIAGLLAWQNGWQEVASILFGLAVLDTILSVKFAIQEANAEKNK